MTKKYIQDTQQKNYMKFNNTNYIKDYIKKVSSYLFPRNM